jgi:hypothetical protein
MVETQIQQALTIIWSLTPNPDLTHGLVSAGSYIAVVNKLLGLTNQNPER